MDDKTYVVRYYDVEKDEYFSFDYNVLETAIFYYNLLVDSEYENLSLFVWNFDTETAEELIKGQRPQDLI